MATIDTLLKNNFLSSDDTPVTLTFSVPMGFVRENSALIKGMTLKNATVNTPAKPKVAAKSAPKRAAASKASTKKAPAAKKATKSKASGKRGDVRVTWAGVSDALGAGHQTPKAIAGALKADAAQVAKALSRYLKAGQVKRIGVGLYQLA